MNDSKIPLRVLEMKISNKWLCEKPSEGKYPEDDGRQQQCLQSCKQIYCGSYSISWSLLVETSAMVVLCLHYPYTRWVFRHNKYWTVLYPVTSTPFVSLSTVCLTWSLSTWFVMSSILILSKEYCQPHLTCPYHFMFNF